MPGQCFGRFLSSQFFFSKFVFLPIFFPPFSYCFFSCQTDFYLWLIYFGQFLSSQILFCIFGLRNLGFLMIDNAVIIFQLGSRLQPQATSKEAESNGKPYQNFRNNNDELNLSRDLFLNAFFSLKWLPLR